MTRKPIADGVLVEPPVFADFLTRQRAILGQLPSIPLVRVSFERTGKRIASIWLLCPVNSSSGNQRRNAHLLEAKVTAFWTESVPRSLAQHFSAEAAFGRKPFVLLPFCHRSAVPAFRSFVTVQAVTATRVTPDSAISREPIETRSRLKCTSEALTKPRPRTIT